MITVLGMPVTLWFVFLIVVGMMLCMHITHKEGFAGSGSGSGSGTYMAPLTPTYVKDCSTGTCTSIGEDTDRLLYFQRLYVGGKLISANGRYVLYYQPTGTLLLNDLAAQSSGSSTIRWRSDTRGTSSDTASYLMNLGSITARRANGTQMSWIAVPNTKTYCPAGQSSMMGGGCRNCPAGQTSVAGEGGECTNCPAGKSSVAGGACTDCPVGLSSVAGGICRVCEPGYYCSGGVAVACAAGKTSTGGLTATTAAACTNCLAGYSSVAGGVCRVCSEGYYCPGGVAVACAAGKTSTGGVTATSVEACTNCSAGQSSVAGGVCRVCPNGYYCPGGVAAVPCEAGKTSTGGIAATTAAACTNCLSGYYCPGGASVPCDPGKSSSGGLTATSVSACTDCSTGYYCPGGGPEIRCSIVPTRTLSSTVNQGQGSTMTTTTTIHNFSTPHSVAVDSTRNVYVAEGFGHKIRKITSEGVITTLAGSGTAGFADGTGAAARFNLPSGIALDSAGNVYAADHNNNRIRKITPAGVVTTLAGSVIAGFADGTGAAARFGNPAGIALDSAGNVYVADYNNNRIRTITPAGVVTTLAGSVRGFADGTGADAMFNGPWGIAVNSAGVVYVAELFGHRIRRITPAGVVTTLAGSGTQGISDGTGEAARFRSPAGIALDSAGNLYVADSGNHKIRRITPQGVVSTFAGTGGGGVADGLPLAAQFHTPYGVAVDYEGNLYVSQIYNGRVRIIPQQICNPITGAAL